MNILFTLILATALFHCFSTFTSAQLGTVDPNFNAIVDAATYTEKRVIRIQELPNGKILVQGRFNHYNNQPVGGLVQLEADGRLDPSFNQHVVPPNANFGFDVFPDGKILLVQGNQISRLQQNGTSDASFSYQPVGTVSALKVDSNGRVVILGAFTIERSGVAVSENVIRLSNDGSVDESFDAPEHAVSGTRMELAGANVALMRPVDPNLHLTLLNESGAIVAQTTPIPSMPQLVGYFGLPDGKLLLLTPTRLYQLNADGTVNENFQAAPFGSLNSAARMAIGSDGRITLALQRLNPPRWTISRLLQDGRPDPSFAAYDYASLSTGLSTMETLFTQENGGVVIGDYSLQSPINRFTWLKSDGSVDPDFNPGGAGFVNSVPGKVRDIVPLPDGKVMIGGDFQRVSGVDRAKLARLNADGTLDTSFSVAMSGTSSYFYQFSEIYSIARQSDGKFLISGNFKYYLNGVAKQLVARINPDGTVDSTFNLATYLVDYNGANSAGPARSIVRPDGRIVVGQSSGNSDETLKVPLALNANGSIDQSFVSGYFGAQPSVHVDHIGQQPDGKIILSGRRWSDAGYLGFLVRLNANGSADPSFQAYERLNYRVVDFETQQDGKIVLAARSLNRSLVLRLNGNGSLDGGFGSEVGANGLINAIAVLPGGEVVAGGKFSTFNDQPRENLAVLDASGMVSASNPFANGEVLSLTQAGGNKLLIGGSFTRIGTGSNNELANRSHIARVRVGPAVAAFDYDGDGKADLSIRRPSDNVWHLLRATAGYTAMQWGIAGDRMAPADYDGDGRTDVAVFRPSEGKWYLHLSASNTFATYNWGQDGDVPLPSDRDADGKADLVIYRPSDNTWYTRFADSTFLVFPFGEDGDKPVTGDFDADGRSDMAVFRPNNSTWYIIRSTAGYFVQTWGEPGDIPVAADFDGDGRTDHAVFRPSTGQWFLSRTNEGFATLNWGAAGDVPVPADYDGDGRADIAVFRPSEGNWYIVQSASGILIQNFGITGDLPTQSAQI